MLHIKLFDGLDPLQHEDVISRFTTVKQYRADEVVVLKGDPGTALLIVLAGEALVRLGEFEARFAPGDFLGEMAFVDGKPRSAKIMASVEATRIAHLSREQMAVIDRDEPNLANRVLWNIAIAQSERQRRTNDALMAMNARQRTSIAHRFPWLARLILGAPA